MLLCNWLGVKSNSCNSYMSSEIKLSVDYKSAHHPFCNESLLFLTSASFVNFLTSTFF